MNARFQEGFLRTVTFILFTGLLLFLAGCGSVSHNMQPSPTPTPLPSPSPSPSPTPMPSPSPRPSPSPSPTPAPAPSPAPVASDVFLSTWFINSPGRNVPPPAGTITLDTTANNGAGSSQVQHLPANSILFLQFCPYPQGFAGCSTVTSFSSDSTGAANFGFIFPLKGTFSGAFQISDGSGNQIAVTATSSTGINFKSALLPAATVTGGIQQTTGNSPGIGSALLRGTHAPLSPP